MRTEARTALTMTTGRTLIVKGTYDDVKLTLAERRMTQDNGEREVTLDDGRRITINRNAIIAQEEMVANKKRNAIGFR